MSKFFNIPFGSSATKTTIPDDDSANVSWTQGYTVNYEYNPLTNNQAKRIERGVMNSLFYDITSSIRDLQLNGISPYYENIIVESGPGYPEGAFVFYNGVVWRSKIANNKLIPNATSKDNWEQVFGYDTLKEKLVNDGFSAGSGGGNGYTKDEINELFSSFNDKINESMNGYLQKQIGEIYLRSYHDLIKNDKGFFYCNGQHLGYNIKDLDDTSEEFFYGNQLYKICFDENGDKTRFMLTWNLNYDTEYEFNEIQLPNLMLEDKGIMLLKLESTGKPNLDETAPYSLSKVDGGVDTYTFGMIPCIYLGERPTTDDDDDDEGENGNG